MNLTLLNVQIAYPSKQQINQLNEICVLNTINSTTQSNTINQQSQTLKTFKKKKKNNVVSASRLTPSSRWAFNPDPQNGLTGRSPQGD